MAAMTALNPSAPAPVITTDVPGCTSRVFKIAPAPVCTPHPSGPIIERSYAGSTLTTDVRATTEWLANDDWPKKCDPTGLPSASMNAFEPSGRPPPMLYWLRL